MFDYLANNIIQENLKNITQEEFDELVEEHKKMTFNIHDNGLRLSNYNLSNLKIKDKNLHYILFCKCLLDNVIFENCNLECADIRYSKVKNTNFINCSFLKGNFHDCEFINSDLSTCNIEKSDFGLSIFDNTKMPNYPMNCPERDSFIGYKMVCDIIDYRKKYLLKLEIPEDAKRSSATSNKCRCDRAKVLEIQNLDGSIAKNIIKVRSIYCPFFIYELGKIVKEPNFDECRWHECTVGIHFFMNKGDAMNYIKSW